MKITIYELLGLIKEGKAPKKIKMDSYILELDEKTTNWKCKYIDNQGDRLFIDYHITLNDEVEIIEKEKEIEKFDPCLGGIMGFDGVTNIFANYRDKINELIDVINDMRDKE